MEISRCVVSTSRRESRLGGVSELFQAWRQVGALCFTVRQGAVFCRRLRRRVVPVPITHHGRAGSRKFLRAEHDAPAGWTAHCLGLGEWITELPWVDLMSDYTPH